MINMHSQTAIKRLASFLLSQFVYTGTMSVTDGKHQEDDAEFGQGAGGLVFLGQAQCMGPDQDADGQVAEHRRQVQHPERHYPEHGAA